MHDRQRIMDAVRDRLLAQCGSTFGGRVHAGRAGAVMVEDEVPLVLVDLADVTSVPWDLNADSELNTYVIDVAVVATGPSPELAAAGAEPCVAVLNELCLPVRRALKRGWALAGGLGVVDPATGAGRLFDWRYAGERLAVRAAGNAGHLAHLTIRFNASVVNEDGEPAA